MLGQVNNFIKKRLQHRFFPVNIAKFLRTTFFIEHLWWLLLTLDLHPMNLGTACSKLRIKTLMWRNFSFFFCCYWWHWTGNYLFVYFVQVRSSRLQVFRTGVLRNFGQNSWENSIVGVSLIKLRSFGLQLYWKKRLWHKFFPVNFAKFKNTFFQNIATHIFYPHCI